MANNITNVMPKILAQGVLSLRQNAIMAQNVNTDYDNLAAQKGNVINIPIPSALAARAVTPGQTVVTASDSAPAVALVTLDRWQESPFYLTDNDVVSADGMIVSMQAGEAVKALANDIDAFILGKHTVFYGAAGTAGTTPFNGSLTVGGAARKLLNKNLAPLDNRFGVIDPDAEQNFLLNTQILQWDQSGQNPAGIITGSIGTKLGIRWYMDQNITTYTPGTGWVTGFAASTVAGAVGDTTLNVLNATASGQVKVGDIFTAGGTQQYVVTVTTTVSATVQSVITFYPALTTAVATGAAITVVATAYIPNLVLNKYALAWASRPLAGILGAGNIFQAPVDPVSGVALRLELSRQYKQETLSFDYLGGCNYVRRELGVKIFG